MQILLAVLYFLPKEQGLYCKDLFKCKRVFRADTVFLKYIHCDKVFFIAKGSFTEQQGPPHCNRVLLQCNKVASSRLNKLRISSASDSGALATQPPRRPC